MFAVRGKSSFKKEIMRKKKYNLIEIALSIAILAIGVTSIVTLFPVGLQQINDSIAENYSSLSSDSMLAYIAREAYSDWNILDTIPTSKPGSILTNTNGWTLLEGDIYDCNVGSGIFGLKIITNNITDFTGEALLWKSQIQNIRAGGTTIVALPYSNAVALHLEVSWPVEKPYARRKKNTFYLELFNYNQ